jgi:hypothetical protein
VGVFQLTTSHDLLSHKFRLRDETRSFRPEARQHAKFPLPVENCNFSEGNPQFPLAAENRDFPDQNPNSPLEAENAGTRPQQETAPIFIAKNVTEFWLRPLSANSGQERLQYYLWTYSAQIGAQVFSPFCPNCFRALFPFSSLFHEFRIDLDDFSWILSFFLPQRLFTLLFSHFFVGIFFAENAEFRMMFWPRFGCRKGRRRIWVFARPTRRSRFSPWMRKSSHLRHFRSRPRLRP